MKILFICEFEEPFKEPEDYDEEEFHHQEGLSSQKAFQSKVQALTDTVMCWYSVAWCELNVLISTQIKTDQYAIDMRSMRLTSQTSPSCGQNVRLAD